MRFSFTYCLQSSFRFTLGMLPAFAFLFTAPASAQEAQGIGNSVGLLPQTVGTTGKEGTSLSLSHFDSATGMQSDVIIGRNLKGPYLLTWKGVRPGSETVLRDGIALKPGIDYTLDADTGAMAFPAPLRPDQLLRVSYRADRPESALNPKSLALPVKIDLWQSGTNRLAFNSLYRPTPSGSPTKGNLTQLQTSLQFNGGIRLAPSSDLSSALFVDMRGGDWLGRSGLRVAERTRARWGEFGLTYSRAGAQFALENTDGLTAGREIMEAVGSLSPASGLKLNGTLRQTTELLDTSKDPPGAPPSQIGAVTREIGQNLTFTLPKGQSKLEAGRLATTVTAPDGSGVVRTQDSLKLEHTLRKGTQATLSYEALSTQSFQRPSVADAPSKESASSPGDYSQKTLLEIKHRPSEQIQLTGTFNTTLGGANAGDSEALRIEASPFTRLRQLKIIASWQDQYKGEGASRSREARVELPTLAWGQLQTSGGIRQTSAPGKERLVGILDAKSRPLRYLELTGGARLRDGYAGDVHVPDPDAVNTYQFKMTLQPVKQFRFIGSLTHNPEADDGTIRKTQRQNLGVETELGLLKLHGQYGLEDEYLSMKQTNTLELGLDLRLTPVDTLSGGFQGRSLLDTEDSETRIFSLAYTRRLGSAFDLTLSGNMTQSLLNRTYQSDKQEIKAQAKLGLKF